MPMASGSADTRSPPLRPAEATITVAIEKAHMVIPFGLGWMTSRRPGRQRRHGRRRTDLVQRRGKADPGLDAR
jgi:hypothetical protein